MTDVTCARCGATSGGGDRFCRNCGAPLGSAPPPPPPDSWEATLARLREATADEYEVEREIGRGGTAAVFVARDKALARRVAIKVAAPQLASDPDMMRRFGQEAITAANLQHSNIVAVHAVRHLPERRLHYFVMQYVEGKPLHHVLRELKPCPLPIVLHVLAEVGSALAYAHENGVVHRDVKPANIIVDVTGACRVTDFGIAKIADATSQTKTGMFLGTPMYACPESWDPKKITAASDQYSLGVIVYEMLAGRLPFEGSQLDILRQHTSAPVPPVTAFRPDCPSVLNLAVLRMLAKNPAERWPTLHEALEACGAHELGMADPLRQRFAQLAGGPPPGTVRSGVPTPRPQPAVTLAPEPPPPPPEQVAPAPPPGPAGAAEKTVVLSAASPPPPPPAPEPEELAPAAESPPPAAEPVDAQGRTVVFSAFQASQPAAMPAQIVVSTPPAAVEVGDRFGLTVSGAGGAAIPPGTAVRWTSEAPGVATVEGGTGVVTAVAAGTVRIVAEAEGRSASVSFAVSAPRPSALRIAPVDAMVVGEQRQLSAVAVDRHGRAVQADVIWSAMDPTGSVTIGGELTALAPGSVRVLAMAGELQETITVEVVEAEAPAPPAPAVPPTPVPAAPPAAGGKIKVRLAGAAPPAAAPPAPPRPKISVTPPREQRAAQPPAAPAAPRVNVPPAAPPPPVAAPAAAASATGPGGLTVTLDGPKSIRVGARERLQLKVVDADGISVGVPVEWTTTDPGVLYVGTDGTIEGRAPGKVRVTATAAGVTHALVIEVKGALLGGVKVGGGSGAMGGLVNASDVEGAIRSPTSWARWKVWDAFRAILRRLGL